MASKARIIGSVKYREGDGPEIPIRKGPLDYVISGQDVILSWTEDETHGSTAMPLADFERYVEENAIELEEP